MKSTSKTIVFFGSGPVAAKSLEFLASNFTIEAVITKPRAPHHKGTVPVIDVAEKLSLQTYFVTNKKSLDELFKRNLFKSQVAVLIDFGIIVSQSVIDFFRYGIVNSHFSLLPQWRGADPITFSILSGQEKTGVSLMLLTQGMDEGPILAFGEFELSQTITTPELTDNLIKISDAMLTEILPAYLAGHITPQPQNNVQPTYSRKLTKEDSLIDWRKPAAVIEREIRAFIEWPKSRTTIGGQDIVITKAHVEIAKGTPGTFFIHNKHLAVYCGENSLIIDKLKPAGKKEMTGQAFLAGYKHLL